MVPVGEVPHQRPIKPLLSVVCWFKKKGSVTPQEGPVYDRISRIEQAYFNRSWTTCPTSTNHRYSVVQRYWTTPEMLEASITWEASQHPTRLRRKCNEKRSHIIDYRFKHLG